MVCYRTREGKARVKTENKKVLSYSLVCREYGVKTNAMCYTACVKPPVLVVLQPHGAELRARSRELWNSANVTQAAAV